MGSPPPGSVAWSAVSEGAMHLRGAGRGQSGRIPAPSIEVV